MKSSSRKRLSCYLYNSAFLRQLQDSCVKITMIWQVQQFCRLKSGTKAHLYLIYNRGLVRAGPGNFHELPAKSPQNTYTPPAWHPQNRLFHLTSETISSASLQNHPGFRQKFTKTANETAKDGLLIFAKRQIVSICTKNREKCLILWLTCCIVKMRKRLRDTTPNKAIQTKHMTGRWYSWHPSRTSQKPAGSR